MSPNTPAGSAIMANPPKEDAGPKAALEAKDRPEVASAAPNLTKIQQSPLSVNPGDDVVILQLRKPGRIKAIYVTRDYISYEIRYLVKGTLETEWFGASEIDLPSQTN